jgi:hypothetical protein
MGSNGLVSIRVEALGVAITVVDGKIAIEQTKTELPAAAGVSEVKNGPHCLTGLPEDSDKVERPLLPQAARLDRKSLPNLLEVRNRLCLAAN